MFSIKERVTLGYNYNFASRYVPFSSLLIPYLKTATPYFPSLQFDTYLIGVITIIMLGISFLFAYYLLSNIGGWTYVEKFHSPREIFFSVCLHYTFLLLLIGIGYSVFLLRSAGLPSVRDLLIGLLISSIYLIVTVQLFSRGIPLSERDNIDSVDEFLEHVYVVRHKEGTREDTESIVAAGEKIIGHIKKENSNISDAPVQELEDWITEFDQHGFPGQKKMIGDLPENSLDIWIEYYDQLQSLEEYLQTVQTPAHVKIIRQAYTFQLEW